VACCRVNYTFTFTFIRCKHIAPGSSVGIATELCAGRSGIESRWERDIPPVQTGPGTHPASCKMGTGSFPGVKCGRDLLLTSHPLLVPRSWKSRVTSLPILWATPGLNGITLLLLLPLPLQLYDGNTSDTAVKEPKWAVTGQQAKMHIRWLSEISCYSDKESHSAVC